MNASQLELMSSYLRDKRKEIWVDVTNVLRTLDVTKHFSNCTNEDSDKINRFFKENNIEGYINRVFKTI